jgi:hypothetical protein
MSDAKDKLTRTRNALIVQMAQGQRRHDPREEPAAAAYPPPAHAESFEYENDEEDDYAGYEPGGGWIGHMRHAVRTWWRYHPAHMAVDLASPIMRNYARRNPWQLVGISFAAGAGIMFLRPWKLLSAGTIAVAVLKSSQIPHLLMAALSAADVRKDARRRR